MDQLGTETHPGPQNFQFSPLAAILTYSSLLAAELFTFGRFVPRILLNADLCAIRLTGDPDTFFSALGGLSRFTGVPLPEQVLREIGRETSVSSARIAELTGETIPKPGDRYPTSGSYMDTGL